MSKCVSGSCFCQMVVKLSQWYCVPQEPVCHDQVFRGPWRLLSVWLTTNEWLSFSFHDSSYHVAAHVLGHCVFWWLWEEKVVCSSCSSSDPSAGVGLGEYCHNAQTVFWNLSPHMWNGRFYSKWNASSWENEEIQKSCLNE